MSETGGGQGPRRTCRGSFRCSTTPAFRADTASTTTPATARAWPSSYLHAQGRRKIVQILENLDTPMSRRRHRGFLAAHRDLGRPLADDQLCLATQGWGRDDYPKFAALCDELLDGRHADAILADNDATAAFLARAIMRRGLRMPDDVALFGWGNETLSPWMNPPLTTVNYRMQDMVTAALDLLTELIERPDQQRERTIHIKPELVLRESA